MEIQMTVQIRAFTSPVQASIGAVVVAGIGSSLPTPATSVIRVIHLAAGIILRAERIARIDAVPILVATTTALVSEYRACWACRCVRACVCVCVCV